MNTTHPIPVEVVDPNKPATTVDVVLSVLFPLILFFVGLAAYLRGQKARGRRILAISSVVMGLVVFVRVAAAAGGWSPDIEANNGGVVAFKTDSFQQRTLKNSGEGLRVMTIRYNAKPNSITDYYLLAVKDSSCKQGYGTVKFYTMDETPAPNLHSPFVSGGSTILDEFADLLCGKLPPSAFAPSAPAPNPAARPAGRVTPV